MAVVLASVNLGEILWTLLVIYLIVMYIAVVITVILDLFRSDDVSGVGKAVWVLALIAFPIISLIVYLVRRGDGIGARHLARTHPGPPPPAPAVPGPPPVVGTASELEAAKRLLDSNAISQADYEKLKAKLLG